MVIMMKMTMIRTMLTMMRMIVHKARESCSTLLLIFTLAFLTQQLGVTLFLLLLFMMHQGPA